MAETASNTKKTDASVLPPGGYNATRLCSVSASILHQSFMRGTPDNDAHAKRQHPHNKHPQTNALSVLRYGKMLVIPLWKH
jgi:hypothetical protein